MNKKYNEGEFITNAVKQVTMIIIYFHMIGKSNSSWNWLAIPVCIDIMAGIENIRWGIMNLYKDFLHFLINCISRDSWLWNFKKDTEITTLNFKSKLFLSVAMKISFLLSWQGKFY